jgi:hypothetical protein
MQTLIRKTREFLVVHTNGVSTTVLAIRTRQFPQPRHDFRRNMQQERLEVPISAAISQQPLVGSDQSAVINRQ